MAKKSERQKAVAYADKWFGEYIKARDKYVCYTCGATRSIAVIQPGHLITRGKYATRWHEDNCMAQCKSCNYRHEFQPEIFTQLWIDDHGVAAYNELVRLSNTPRKWLTSEIRSLGEYYKERFKEIGGRI